ncbi:MAG: 50S ribosomal protein L31 [Alphaproteobacteria bacterium]|nr:50S ribosomal protein L31 [Alphaproteobacteria bacterium]
MKEGIHPDYHDITVVMTDGSKFTTRSTWGKAGEVMKLDVDSKSHPAWVGGVSLRKTGQMEKFSKKFAALSGGEAKKEPEKKAEAPKAEKKADAEAKPAKKAPKK